MWRAIGRLCAWAGLAAALLTMLPGPAMAECLPWSAAGPVIAQHSLVPGNVVYDQVQSKTGGKVIHASLCEEKGRFIYKLVVLGKQGDVTNVTVDARTGRF